MNEDKVKIQKKVRYRKLKKLRKNMNEMNENRKQITNKRQDKMKNET